MELFIIRDGQQTGPFSEESVQTLLKQGGLRADDLGWHKGLPAWLPLSEVFRPEAQHRMEPPPLNGAASGVRPRPASARQKALLQYIGTAFSSQTTREEAALTISEAMENPKLTSRLAKWGDEKVKLHPELFQEEIDYRRANRISRYLELCQTEGAEVVKDVTKAHVQVLMESLDKRQVGWDEDSHSALWDYLLPTVAEHFPQLIQEEWKGKLKYGGTSKVAAAYAGVPATGALSAAPPPHPSAIQAILRGVIYGVVALALVLGGIYVFRDTGKSDIARTEVKSPAPEPLAATAGLNPAPADVAAEPPAAEPVHPTKAPLIGAEPNAVIAAAPPAEAPAANPPAETPPVPAVAEAAPPVAPATPAPAMNAATAFTPAPAPPGATPNDPGLGLDAPAAPAPAVRNSATLIQAVTVQLQFGKVTLNPGTRVRLIALEGANARVNFNNNIVLVPVASTDLDPANTIVAAAPPVPVVALPTPLAPPANPTPSSTAPKLPSADL